MARLGFNRKGVKYNGDINNLHYNSSFAGNSLTCMVMKNTPIPSDVDAKNVVARGENFDWSETYNAIPVMEWDTYFIQEVVLGMQDLGSFGAQTMFTLRLNDSLPSVRTLAHESELQILQAVGQDSTNKGEVLNAFFGGRFVGRNSGMNPRGIVQDSIRGVYRYRLSGKEWKFIDVRSPYPGGVEEVDLDSTITPIPTSAFV